MKRFIFPLCLFVMFSLGSYQCVEAEQPPSLKSTKKLDKPIPKNWIVAIETAKSFQEETELLTTLIQIDSTNQYQQIIANRLQTFDLRHLSEAEKIIILDLYKKSLSVPTQVADNIFQTAHAKLKSSYPTQNEQVDQRLTELIQWIEKVGRINLEAQ